MNTLKKRSKPDPDGRLNSLLLVAESQAKRARLALHQCEIAAINDYAFLTLASAIYTAKVVTGLTWSGLTEKLHSPCSEEMLRKIASRAKSPSKKTFNTIRSSLVSLSNVAGFDLPKIEEMRDI